MAESEPVSNEQPLELIEVEVAVAWPEQQVSVHVKVRRGATLADAIEASGLAERFPQLDIAPDRLGVFGELRKPDAAVHAGDRVEIYRALQADPKEVRREMARLRAEAKNK